MKYHQGPKSLCVDLGSGHGVVAREFASFFDRVIGTDPSSGMIQQARSLTSADEYPNVTYEQASAENMPFLTHQGVDTVVSGQAAHWFDPEEFFPEMKRVVRKGGTLAFWCYKDHVFVDYPRATRILDRYCYGEEERMLGPYWQQPGRNKVQNKLRDLRPPEDEWTDIQRIEYEPSIKGPKSGEGTMFLSKRMTLGVCMNYIRTWSAFGGWQEKFPQLRKREDGGSGDVIDEMFDEMVQSEPDWATCSDWKSKEVDIEWGSGLVLARKN